MFRKRLIECDIYVPGRETYRVGYRKTSIQILKIIGLPLFLYIELTRQIMMRKDCKINEGQVTKPAGAQGPGAIAAAGLLLGRRKRKDKGCDYWSLSRDLAAFASSTTAAVNERSVFAAGLPPLYRDEYQLMYDTATCSCSC
jgi:hypothetical protein